MRSMTGCGNGLNRSGEWEVTAEIRSVNHRFLDISMRLPRNIGFLETAIRGRIAERLRRGHVDVYVTVRRIDASAVQAVADMELARHYLQIAEELADKTGMPNDMTVSRVLDLEGVVTVTEREMDQEMVTELALAAADQALDQLIAMRAMEGMNLKKDLCEHLDIAAGIREQIRVRAPYVVDDYRERLNTRLRKLGAEGVEPQRIAQEVALIADRCAIDEELSRLDSHIKQMKSYLDAEGEIGKKMDFLIQEMNREANTIGSKASDAEIAQHVVNLKSEIEKLREQIQNVE